ncbi:MAG: glycosyltransferase [Desulfurococcaceae archaeon]|nr:glycosyltransferase [Desulfurococcaceae archaeon]
MQDLIIVSRAGSSQQTYMGGADASAYYIFEALSRQGYTAIYLILCTNCKSVRIQEQNRSQIVEVPLKHLHIYSFNFMSIKNTNTLTKSIEKLQTLLKLRNYKNIYVIVKDPISLHYWIHTKRKLKKNNYNINLLWVPGGNELTCPLHTEICPYSNSYTKTYGHSISASFFFTKCIPHIIKTRGLSIYHLTLYPYLRKETIKYIDGILATRTVYIEGCKLLGLKKCKYIGFGIDTDIFTPREKDEVVRKLSDVYEYVKTKNVWGNFDFLLSEASNNKSIILGFIGATRPLWKNVELLIKVFKDISKQYENIYLLVIVREAPILSSLLYGLPKEIHKKIVVFNGIPHIYVPLFYNLIDIFINPSLLDSLEINTLEALVSGNFVLASNRGCINDLRYLGIESYLIFEPNKVSLLNTLTQLLKNFDYYRMEMIKSLDHVRQILSLNSYGRRIVKALDEMSLNV